MSGMTDSLSPVELIAEALRAHSMLIVKCKCGWRCNNEYTQRYALNAAHDRHRAEVIAAFWPVPAQLIGDTE